MIKGMTLKQFARQEFWDLLDAYGQALRTGQNITQASIRIHAAKAGVPKSWWPHVNRVFRDTPHGLGAKGSP